MNQVNSIYPDEKGELYSLLESQTGALLKGETNQIANLANVSALLNLALPEINWVGFYLMQENELILGPFQGKPACIHIPLGKGVCGTAAAKDEIEVVQDVHQFPGHIACDSESASEVVIPLHSNGLVVGVLDIDSPSVARFDEEDARHLARIAKLIETACFPQR
jgi:L-methionine (R)-S-oxide reductase